RLSPERKNAPHTATSEPVATASPRTASASLGTAPAPFGGLAPGSATSTSPVSESPRLIQSAASSPNRSSAVSPVWLANVATTTRSARSASAGLLRTYNAPPASATATAIAALVHTTRRGPGLPERDLGAVGTPVAAGISAEPASAMG